MNGGRMQGVFGVLAGGVLLLALSGCEEASDPPQPTEPDAAEEPAADAVEQTEAPEQDASVSPSQAPDEIRIRRPRPEPAPAAQPQQQTRELIRVATLEGAETNRLFQQNVQLMERQRQQLGQLNERIGQTADPSQRQQLEAQRDELLEHLNRNNQQMMQMYGFSLGREYVLAVERSHIYVAVSPEEAAALEAADSAEEAD